MESCVEGVARVGVAVGALYAIAIAALASGYD